jgi:colanic acid/amylovoran biosynthesis glycosyltransferase
MERDSRPVIAHAINPFLFLTGSWIHAQLRMSGDFRHLVLCQKRENAGLFPHEPVREALSSMGPAARAWNSFSARWLGRYPLDPYRRWVLEEGGILLHGHFGWEGCRILPLARATGLPLVTTMYGLDVSREVRRPHWRRRYVRLFREGMRFFVEGSHMARVLAEAGCPRDKIRVVPLGIDLERITFRPRKAAPGEPVRILFSGSFREKKGADDAVEAFARVAARFPAARLVLLGDGERRADVEAAIERHGCGGAVELRGYVGYPEYVAELGRAHILIAPSRTAADGDTEGGAPVTVIEAQAAGLPVVSTTHCDIPEVTVPGESALLAPERDVTAIAANLEALLADPGAWGRRGASGRRHIEERHDARKQAARMAAEYRDVLAECRKEVP